MALDSWEDFQRKLGEDVAVVRSTMDQVAHIAGNDRAEDVVMAQALIDVRTAIAVMKDQAKVLENRLASGIEPVIGEVVREVGDYVVTVAWPEKLDWDDDALVRLVGSNPAGDPAFVDRIVKIDKRAFDRADPADQAAFLPALTRKPGTRKVEVEKRS